MADRGRKPRRSYLTASQILLEIENMPSSLELSDDESVPPEPPDLQTDSTQMEKTQGDTGGAQTVSLYCENLEQNQTREKESVQSLISVCENPKDLTLCQDSWSANDSGEQALINLSVPSLEALIQDLADHQVQPIHEGSQDLFEQNQEVRMEMEMDTSRTAAKDTSSTETSNSQLVIGSQDLFEDSHQEIPTEMCHDTSTSIVQAADLADIDLANESMDPDFVNPSTDESLSEEEVPNATTSMKRKRRKTKNPAEWKQNIPRDKRLKGMAHISRKGFEREARVRGPKCSSSFCIKSNFRNCNEINEEECQKLFSDFWSLESWEERKRIVGSLTAVSEKKQTQGVRSSRGKPVSYFLKCSDGKKRQVCKSMFASTLGIPIRTLGFWLSNKERDDTPATVEEAEKDKNETTYSGKKLSESDVNFLKTWLGKIPVVDSHYCRKSDTYKDKKFLEPGTKVIDLHKLYVKDANENGIRAVGYTYFKQMFCDLGFSIFRPRKDQCDECISAKQGHTDREAHQKHLLAKDKARSEKMTDKKRSEEDETVSVWTQDAQAVLLCPSTKASALYYKCKLQVHNFTAYNLTNKEGHCYLWDETNGSLKSEVFAHIIYAHYKDVLLKNPQIKELILWSDGAMYQNKNTVLSNALLQLSMETNVCIFQKYLVVGHTQMECDSMHATIERSIKSDIFTPRDYAVVMENSRKSPRYIVHQMNFSTFKKMSKTRFNSIRPGRKTGDPTVTQVSHLRYEPNGAILYKLFHSDPEVLWQDLPTRISPFGVDEVEWQQLYKNKLPITKRKFDDLQNMKKVLPIEAGLFYDSLDFE